MRALVCPQATMLVGASTAPSMQIRKTSEEKKALMLIIYL
jgi:hypothetical protein